MSDKYVTICLVVAFLAGAAVMISENLRTSSQEELRVKAFRQCMNTMGTTEAVCKEVVDGK
jgi:CDP-diacylglycerol pyrophosphatase